MFFTLLILLELTFFKGLIIGRLEESQLLNHAAKYFYTTYFLSSQYVMLFTI